MPSKKAQKKFSSTKEVKALSREQVGRVRGTRVETPKLRRRPKHPERLLEQDI
jgi:hypothetical protein